MHKIRQSADTSTSIPASEVLTEVTIDGAQFQVTWNPFSRGACILWICDGETDHEYQALGQFSSYDRRTVLQFLAQYVTSSELREEIRRRKFLRRIENLPSSFFEHIERLSCYQKGLAYRNLFNLDTVFDRDDLNMRWRIMARKFHPDVGGNTRHMMLINEAYEYLLSRVDS